jgi:Na+/melibiose symporter-like transporter
MKEVKRPSKKEMWFFALGQLGWSILGGLVSNLLVNYYLPDSTDGGLRIFIPQGAILLGLTVIGLITAFGRVFDAVTDPIIANFSDNCKSKKGKRIPFLRWSALPFAVVTVLVFCATFENQGLNVAWLAIFLMLFYLGMTAYCTPFNALIPVLGHEQEDRMNISTYISLTYIVGTGVAFGANIIWTQLANMTGMDYYLAAKLVIIVEAAIALVCMWIPAFGIKETDYNIEQQKSENPFKSLKKTFSNGHFRLFVLSDILYWIGITIFNTGFLYYVSNLLNCYDWYMVLFIFMTLVTFICYIPANILTKKFGKKRMVIIGFITFALAFGICALAGKITFIPNLVYGFIICVFVGVPLAILGIVPQAIVADIAEQDYIKTGENHDGMFYAARTFAFKLGQGLAMIIFTSLAVVGQYTTQNDLGEDVIANSGVGYRISLLVALAFSILAAVALIFYNEKDVMGTINEAHAKETVVNADGTISQAEEEALLAATETEGVKETEKVEDEEAETESEN